MWIGSRSSQSTSGTVGGLDLDRMWIFTGKSNYHGPSLALEEGDEGEMHLREG